MNILLQYFRIFAVNDYTNSHKFSKFLKKINNIFFILFDLIDYCILESDKRNLRIEA
jgi:hypothetical protein